MEGAYIYDTVRSPRGRGKNGSLNELTAVALSAKILQELRERNNLNTQEIEDVIWGNVTQVGDREDVWQDQLLLLPTIVRQLQAYL